MIRFTNRYVTIWQRRTPNPRRLLLLWFWIRKFRWMSSPGVYPPFAIRSSVPTEPNFMQKSEIGDDERVSSGSESIWKEMGEELISLSNKSENSPRTCLCLLVEIFNSDYSECLEADDVKVPRPFTNCSASVAHKSEFTLERAGQVFWQSVGKWNLVKSCWKRSSLNKDK